MPINYMMKKLNYRAFFGICLLAYVFFLNVPSVCTEDIIENDVDNQQNNNKYNNNHNNVAPVMVLTEDNWRLMLKGEWMVEFYAPWCPACKKLKTTWERFAGISVDLNINVAKIDVTTSSSLSGRFFVTALPTIYHVKNGDFRQYRGSRDFDALQSFIRKKEWKQVEPISAWKKPDTIHMSVLSYIFKLSHTLKQFNIYLQEEFGLPSWGAYALFAGGTIFLGAILGLILVCIIDFLYSPKKSTSTEREQRDKIKHDMEELAIDEIEDEDNSQLNGDDNDDDIEEASTEEEQIEEDEEDDNMDDAKNHQNKSNKVIKVIDDEELENKYIRTEENLEKDEETKGNDDDKTKIPSSESYKSLSYETENILDSKKVNDEDMSSTSLNGLPNNNKSAINKVEKLSVEQDITSAPSTEVRKRKARKAD